MNKPYLSLLTLSVLLVVNLSCKPMNEEGDSTLMAAQPSGFDIFKTDCKISCVKIKNWGTVHLTGGAPTAKEEATKLFDQKQLFSLAAFIKQRVARASAKVSVTRDAGTQGAPAGRPADRGAAPSKSNFIKDHFAIDAAGLHFSSSKNLRDILEAEAKQMDKLQVDAAKKEDAKSPGWWDKVLEDGGVHALTNQERLALKKKELALVKERREILKAASPLYKEQMKGGVKASFSGALDTFKKTEKIRISTDFEVYHVGPKITGEAFVAGKVLKRRIGGVPRFIQLIASAGVDDKTSIAADNQKKESTTITGGVSVRAVFFGTDISGLPKGDFGKITHKAFAVPTIPKIDIPVYGFPAGGVAVEITLTPQLGLGFDVDVKSGTKLTMTFDPSISLVMGAGVFVKGGPLALGIEGSTTILAFEVPIAVSLAWNPSTKKPSYMGLDYVGGVISALGGTGISIIAKAEIPSPFNYVLWGVKVALKLAGFNVPGELGIVDKGVKYAYPIWEPEYKLILKELALPSGPSFLVLPKSPTKQQCADISGQILDHIAFTKRESDATSDAMLKTLDAASTKTLVKLQQDIRKKCP